RRRCSARRPGRCCRPPWCSPSVGPSTASCPPAYASTFDGMDAREWDERFSGSELVYGASANDVVVELTTSLPRGSAVDIGCGEGRNAVFLATRGWTVEGIDFSQVALDKAARLAQNSPRAVIERLTWTCADLTTADFGTSRDLALISYIH